MNYYGTDESQLGQPKEPLPDLCHKCGRCCRSATSYHSPKKLQTLAEKGSEDARRFLEVFIPYESIDDARKVVPEQVDQIVEAVGRSKEIPLDELTFYHCKHVTKEGLCGIYESRPEFCKDAPGHGWSVMPPGCGFEGWQFEQREKHKHMIRELKNAAYVMTQLSPDGKTHPLRPETTLDELNELVDSKIKPWLNFGAEFW